LMWYAYIDDLGGTHIPLQVDRVKEIIALNGNGKKPGDLKEFAEFKEVKKEPEYSNVDGQDSLTRFDTTFKKKKKKKKKKNPNQQSNPQQSQNSQPQNSKPGEGKKNHNRNRNKNRNKNKGGNQNKDKS